MASFTISRTDKFPSGTSVSAYPRSNWLQSQIPPTGSPQGSATTSATATASGVAFSGLTADTAYYAYAQVGGVDTYVGFATDVASVASVSSQALAATTVKTSAYTAVSGDLVPVDATAGSVTVTLPASPVDRDRVAIKLIATSGSNVCTIARGGSDVFNKTAGSTSLTLSLVNQGASLQYAASSGIWYVVSTDVPLSGLDTRYGGIPTVINAKDTTYGAKGDGSTDDATAINAALTAAGTAGGGIVYLPVGTYIVGATLSIPDQTWLQGAGWGTVIKAKTALNAAVITNTTADSVGIGVERLTIDGNRAGQSSGAGISFSWTGTTLGSTSPHFVAATINDVYIRFTKDDGVKLVNATNGMNTVMDSVQCVRCDGNGFNIQASDGQYTNCQSEKAGLAGFSIGPNAAASHLSNCIGSDSGQVTAASGHGFKYSSGRCTTVACMAQSNSMHGFYIVSGTGGSDNVFTGCMAESNSFANAGSLAAGFYVDSLEQRTIITGCYALDRFTGGSRTQAYGFVLNGSCDNNRIHGYANNNTTASVLNNSSGTNNVIEVNTPGFERLSPVVSRATGVLAQTMARTDGTADLSGFVSGRLRLGGLVRLQGGQKYSSITFATGATAAGTPLNQWFSMYDTAGNLLCTTADDTTTAWAANTAKSLAIAKDAAGATITYYQPAADITVWVCHTVVATTMPSIVGASVFSGLTNILPVLAADGANTLTTPATAPATITVGSLVASTKVCYAHVT